MPHEPVQHLRIEVRRFVRHGPTRVTAGGQPGTGRRRDQECHLTAALAGGAHGGRLVGGVVHVGAGVERVVGDAEQRLEQGLVEDGDRQLAPRPARPGRPRDRASGVVAQPEHHRLAPATTPIVRDVGVIVVGSPPKGATSNQARAAVANLSSENPGTPWTSRWLARIVSPGASSVQNAIILSVAPGWFFANATAVSYRWWPSAMITGFGAISRRIVAIAASSVMRHRRWSSLLRSRASAMGSPGGAGAARMARSGSLTSMKSRPVSAPVASRSCMRSFFGPL